MSHVNKTLLKCKNARVQGMMVIITLIETAREQYGPSPSSPGKYLSCHLSSIQPSEYRVSVIFSELGTVLIKKTNLFSN